LMERDVLVRGGSVVNGEERRAGRVRS